MLDITNLSYQAILLTEDGKQIELSDALSNLDWEEYKNEISMRTNLTFYNSLHEGQVISNLAKPGCMVIILAECGSVKQEVARGIITDWTVTDSGTKTELNLVCYDELYYLQKSNDNLYYSAGIGTQSIIMDILNTWGIPVGTYQGPDVAHAKVVYKTEYLSDVILDLLDDAVKRGGAKCYISAHEGKVNILPWGGNETVYHFGTDNLSSAKTKYSTANLITRVKIIGQEDNDGKTAVEAILDGKTEFGIRQKIYIRNKDDSLATAQSAAQEIIDDKGDIEKTFTIEAPDVPFIRKGDMVHVTAGTLDGYYYVIAVRHNGMNQTMTMDLEKIQEG